MIVEYKEEAVNTYLLLQIYTGLNYFANAIISLIWVYCVMSWFVRPTNRLYQFLERFLYPVLEPFRIISRKLIRSGFMIDISPVLATLAIRLIMSLILRLMIGF